MKRLSLAGQVALIVAGAIFLAQIFNLSLAIEHRRDLALSEAVGPAANRLAFAAESPDLFDRRDARREWRRERLAERLGGERSGGERGPRRERALKVRLSDDLPAPAEAPRLPELESLLVDRLVQNDVASPEVRVVTLAAGHRHDSDRSDLLFALRLDDGRWASVRAPGPPSARPLVLMLTLQSLVIGLLILLPTLWLLRRVGGSLTRLKDAARAFDGTVPPDPVPATGPSDVAGLIEAVNAMQARIATMLREKDVMLGAIGHDLRTPLAALRIEAEGVDDNERREALVAQVERLHGQFEAILELARSARPLTPGLAIDPDLLFDRLADTYAGRPVTLDRTPHAPFAGDPVAIERALANLIDNALRFGSRVDVSLSVDRDDATFLVEDDGPGIPEGERETMMRPFERGEASRSRETGGHGLGLAIVAAIARRHRGYLDLAARLDGATGLAARLVIPRLSVPPHTLH